MTALDTRARPGTGAAGAPPAVRFRRPGWRDPRLLVGVLLVCLSVVLGAHLLGSRDDVTQVWALTEPVSAGEALGSADLRPLGVRFADPADAERYVSAGAPVPAGTVVTRDLGAGELVPLAALGQDGERLLELPVAATGGGVPAGVAPGDRVDVWVVPNARASTRGPKAELVLGEVPVLRVGGRGMGGPDGTRQVVVGVEEGTELAGAVGRLADSHVVLVRRP
jgi:Flp pilus assembly protein CpaB